MDGLQTSDALFIEVMRLIALAYESKVVLGEMVTRSILGNEALGKNNLCRKNAE